MLEAFCEMFSDAPIYTLVHVPGSSSDAIEKHSICTSFLNKIPGIQSNYRKYLPLMPLAANNLKISGEFDVVLSSSHCVIKGVPKPPGTVHVSYVHSPMRYMYDQYDQYFGSHAPAVQRLGARVFRSYLTNWDKASNENVDILVANSNFVRSRIRKFYDREAIVVHPFVELSDFSRIQASKPAKTDEFVMVTAFAPNKRVDLAIEAFNQLKRPLTIIGSGQLERELKAMAGPTIRFLGSVSRDEVVNVLARSQALIFPGVEDFGITPLEALAAATPVIAFQAGGVLETLTDEDTVFFDEATPSSLIAAIQRFDGMSLTPNFDRLTKFSRERFQREILDIIESARRAL